jgi:DNA-binding NtrC family response regulator
MRKRDLKILLVDDDEKFLKSFSKRVELAGYWAVTATSGREAIEAAKQYKIDLAVVDQKMPEMDGLVTITKLKEIHPHVKTVLLTGFGDEKLKEATEALSSSYFDKEDMGKFWDFLANLPVTKKEINILLVDDDEKLLETMAAKIRLKGYEPITASRGGDAIEIAKRHKIHVAIVDQKMPDMDGLLTITKLKEIHPGIKTILLTAFGDEKLREATEALSSSYFDKEDMGRFWGFVRNVLTRLENTMAAAGMATGGDLDDAVKMEEDSHKDKSIGD